MSDPSLPASTTPVQDYLDRPAPGATVDHLVVPRSLAQSMPLRWQQVFVGLLADLHDAYAELPWPDYKVVPSRWERARTGDERARDTPGTCVRSGLAPVLEVDLGPTQRVRMLNHYPRLPRSGACAAARLLASIFPPPRRDVRIRRHRRSRARR